MYAGLSFGFFLKLRTEKNKLGTLNRRALEQRLQAPHATNAAPCWATSRSARGGARQVPVRGSPLGDEVYKLW